MSTFLLYGVSNVGFGFALMFNPNAFYHSPLARLAHEKTGLRMTDVSTAPGFNNALACMVIAVGAGSIRAGLTGSRGAQSTIALMRIVWTTATFASCIVAPEVMSASHAISAVVDVFMCAALLWGGGFSIPELLGLGTTTRDRSGGKSRSKRR